MKKRMLAMAFALSASMAFSACGGGTAEEPADDNAASVEETASGNEETEECYFKDNVLVAEDVKIEITDYKVIPVGEPGNEYSDKPVIAFWYNTTNITGKEFDPGTAWIAMFTAIQDNNPNAINELEVGMLPDEQFLDSQLETIKQGGTVANAIAYELDDDTTPVTLKATKGIGGEVLGEQNFEIK